MARNSGTFRTCFLAVGIIILSDLPANGQEIIPSSVFPLSDSLRLSSLTFDHILNTHIWTGNFQKEIHSQTWSADIHQHIQSRLIKIGRIAIQDEYQGLISLKARLSEKWNIRLQNTSSALADNQVIDLGRMAQHQFLSGFEYIPSTRIIAEALGGYEINFQEQESDKGFAYALGFDANGVKLEEFDAFLQSSWNQSFIGRRSPRTGDMKLTLFRDFGEGVNDSLIVSYSTQRREFYTTLNNLSQEALGIRHNIFQRDVSVLEIANQTKYDVGRDFSLLASFNISNRVIERGNRYKDFLHPQFITLDSHIQEMQLYGSLLLRWQVSYWLNADVNLAYTEREEKHSVKDNPLASDSTMRRASIVASRLENTAGRTVFTVGLTSDITRNDRIHLISSASILRYDTPDTLNTDDRDELFLTSGIEVIHRFSSHLALTLTADLTLFHLVYLHSGQSANNNWNRVLRLSPSVEYKPAPWFRTVARTEVLANYTISDYEQQVASIRSFSFRQALWSDSTIMQISKSIRCNFSGSLRIFERGILLWKEFKERPEEYIIEKTLWPEIVWSSTIGLKVGIGFRYFGQDRYKYQGGQRIFSQGFEASGPTALVEWSGLGSEKVTISGWREEQKRNGTTTATISNLSIQVGFIL
jgi:hypothetical protein